MNHLWRSKLVAVYCVLQMIPVSYSQTGWCFPGKDYYRDCNRCWCVADGIFICSKMDCKAIPEKFWGKVKRQQGIEEYARQRSLLVTGAALAIATEVAKEVMNTIGEVAKKEFKDAVKEIALDHIIEPVKSKVVEPIKKQVKKLVKTVGKIVSTFFSRWRSWFG